MRKKIIGCFVFLAVFLLFGEVGAVSISPPVIEIDVNPGDQIERTIKVNNETEKERTYIVGVKKFEMIGEEGYQKFIPIEENNDDFGLTSWIKYNETKIVVSPKSSKEFKFTIDIPLSADPGGHYASVYFSTGAENVDNDASSAVGVQAQINSLILFRVSGDVVEKAEIESFDLENGKILLYHLPVNFVFRVKNEGNVHIMPIGNIEIKNMFGKKVEVLNANPKNNRVLPESIRKIESQWGSDEKNMLEGGFIQELKNEYSNFAFGKYSARLDAVYGNGNQNLLSGMIIFWIIPWRLILVFVIIFVFLLFGIVILIKKYNKWVVKKHLHSV
ncbi:MAG: DUF916 domain-containing protein [Patescibacteria group bacterium]|nr:DUF916 domain-containing protein [Patescibacteria group bacterium]